MFVWYCRASHQLRYQTNIAFKASRQKIFPTPLRKNLLSQNFYLIGRSLEKITFSAIEFQRKKANRHLEKSQGTPVNGSH